MLTRFNAVWFAMLAMPLDRFDIAELITLITASVWARDALVFEALPLADAAPAPSDFTGAVDNAPAPSDLLTAPIAPLADQRLIAPIYNGHYYHIGITYGAHEPAVADSGVVANGVPISANG